MAYIDTLLEFSDSQAVTADAVGTNVISLLADRSTSDPSRGSGSRAAAQAECRWRQRRGGSAVGGET